MSDLLNKKSIEKAFNSKIELSSIVNESLDQVGF